MKNEQAALQFCEAIRTLAANPEHLNNLESYLTYHFTEWLTKYANTPDGIASELEQFANMTF